MLRLLLVCLAIATAADAAPRDSHDLAYGTHRDQRMDVYWDDSTRAAPIIVMLHGGAWAIGDKRNRQVWEKKVAHWRPRGYVFASVNTRLLPDARPDEQIGDFARAVAWVQKNARRFGGDPRRVVIMGHSAGAHVAAFVGGDRATQRASGLRPIRGTVVLDVEALDIPRQMTDNPRRLFRRAFGGDPAYWRATSPLHALDSGAAPFLMVCSSRRAGVCAQARAFAVRARSQGTSAAVLPVRKSHGAINGDLGKPSAYTDAVSDWISARVSP